MTDFSIRNLPTLFLSLFLVSCIDNGQQTDQWTKHDLSRLADSIEIVNLLAGYDDGDGISLLIRNDSSDGKARIITRIPNYPDIVDTLVQTDISTFKSLKRPTIYSINDSEVVVTLFQKIIHPSSNWQGQTPWKETIVSTYPRRDLNLK